VVSQHPGELKPGLSAWVPLACYQALLALGTVMTTFLAPETRGRDLSDLRDAVEEVEVSPSLAAVRP
jgi:MHS family metabolite:H+ symporter-like MFS transporter